MRIFWASSFVWDEATRTVRVAGSNYTAVVTVADALALAQAALRAHPHLEIVHGQRTARALKELDALRRKKSRERKR